MLLPNAEADGNSLAALQREGWCIIPQAIDRDTVARLASDLAPDFSATPRASGPFYGSWTKRFHGLLARSRHMDAFVRSDLVLPIVEQILARGCDCIQLNLTQAIEILPGGRMQPPHRDQDMWPVRQPGLEYLVNVMWPFVPYTRENGGTVIWPGSHLRQDQIAFPLSQAIIPELVPGDALLFLGSTLHAGGANRTAASRRGMIVSYSLGWLKPYELPWLVYPPEIARGFPRELAELAGYRSHRPNLGTYEGRCASALLEPTSEALGAVDTLRPEQEALIGQFYAGAFDSMLKGHAHGC